MAQRPRPDWHPADVMAALRKTPERWSLRGLSLAHGYSANAVGEALRRPWPAVERIVADALGMEPWDIWPSRYTANHQAKRGRIHPQRGAPREERYDSPEAGSRSKCIREDATGKGDDRGPAYAARERGELT